ncbi:hypothetical protein GE09DRAFT_1175303 [Coniochaeta sp. 2T2.1]|nr:hypothetical protein GE09DRAFT_1175303 [Coniochaeta sp. 2T2.1]
MNYASMIEEKRLKQGFIIATLISTIVGTFTRGINLFDRISDKHRQHTTDHGHDQKIRELERRVNETESRRRPSRSRSPPRRRGDDDLRGSLEYGGPMVRREYDRGYADIGPRFAEGDPLVTGRPPDVQTLLNASEFAREGSVKALRDQYQRLLQSAPIQRPTGLVRRISSTPTLRDGATASSATADWTGRSRQQKAIAFNKPGPLFCPYVEDLQRTSRPLHSQMPPRGSRIRMLPVFPAS